MRHKGIKVAAGAMFEADGKIVAQAVVPKVAAQDAQSVAEMRLFRDGFGSDAAFNVLPDSHDEMPSEFRAEVSRVFGASFVADTAKMQAVAQVAREFRRQGAKILVAAVQMGRSLGELREQIGDEDFARAVRESRVIFCGWSAGNLSKMMAVARFVDSGSFEMDRLPQNWSTVYELTTLGPEHLKRAVQGDLLRPDVTRNQVKAFKLRLLQGPAASTDPEMQDSAARNLAAARKRLAALDARAAAMKDARRKLVEQISGLEQASRRRKA